MAKLSIALPSLLLATVAISSAEAQSKEEFLNIWVKTTCEYSIKMGATEEAGEAAAQKMVDDGYATELMNFMLGPDSEKNNLLWFEALQETCPEVEW